jgi:hypothetical protein
VSASDRPLETIADDNGQRFEAPIDRSWDHPEAYRVT